MNFIKTTDFETAEKLRGLQFQEIKSNEVGVFVFINNSNLAKQRFQKNIDKKHISYTNVLCI